MEKDFEDGLPKKLVAKLVINSDYDKHVNKPNKSAIAFENYAEIKLFTSNQDIPLLIVRKYLILKYSLNSS